MAALNQHTWHMIGLKSETLTAISIKKKKKLQLQQHFAVPYNPFNLA